MCQVWGKSHNEFYRVNNYAFASCIIVDLVELTTGKWALSVGHAEIYLFNNQVVREHIIVATVKVPCGATHGTRAELSSTVSTIMHSRNA